MNDVVLQFMYGSNLFVMHSRMAGFRYQVLVFFAADPGSREQSLVSNRAVFL